MLLNKSYNGIIHHFPEKSNGFVETFLVEENARRNAEQMKEAKLPAKRKGKRKVSCPYKKTEEEIEANFEEAKSSPKPVEKAKRLVQSSRKAAEKKQNTKNAQLHQEKMERFPPLPYRRAAISPEAEKFPFPSEKDKILSFSPSIESFTPLTVNRMHLSEKASTLSTPVIVSLLLFSNVRRLFVSFCIRHCMRSSKKI